MPHSRPTVLLALGQSISEEAIEEAVQAYARAVFCPDEWSNALSLTSSLVGGVACTLDLADLNNGTNLIECPYELDASVIKRYQERIYQINPRIRRARAAPIGSIADDHQLLPHDDPHTPEFLDWLKETPSQFVLGAKVLAENGHEGYFSTHFEHRQEPVDAEQIDFHKILVPHLINFLQASRALSGRKLRAELTTYDALDGGRPFALLDKSGGMVECSSAFAFYLGAGGLITANGSKLLARHSRHRTAVERFIKAAVGERRAFDPPLPIRLTSPTHVRGIVLRAVPLPPRHEIFDIFRPTALVTLTDLDAPYKVRRNELVSLFSLTTREADVAALVAEGQTIEQVASTLLISVYTVKQHLKAVFAKIGIERQSELVALVAKLG